MSADLIKRDDALAAIETAKRAILRGDKEGGWTAFMGETIRALPAVTVVVKPLVWEESLKGRYIGQPVSAFGRLAFWVFATPTSYIRHTKTGTLTYDTLEAAKAAAQADYKNCILTLIGEKNE